MNNKHKETNKAIKDVLKHLKAGDKMLKLADLETKAIAYNEKTPIYISYSRSEAGKISYITEKKLKALRDNVEGFKVNNKTRKKYFYHTTPIKFFRKFYNIEDSFFSSYAMAEKVAKLEYVLSGWSKMKLRKVSPEMIPQLYKEADVVGSCMSDKPLKFFEIYTKLESGGGYAIELGGEVVGRFLYHTQEKNPQETKIYIDRIYLRTDNNETKTLIYENIYKHFLTSFDIVQGFNTRSLSREFKQTKGIKYGAFEWIKLTEDCSELEYYPFADSFKYLDEDGKYLYFDEDSEANKLLDCTGGSYSDYENRVCECCGASIDEDEERWCEDVSESRCEDCSVWSDADSVYYAEENATYIAGNVESYVHNNDIEQN